MSKTIERRWLKPDEVALYLGITRGAVYNAIAKGLLPASKTPGIGLRLDKHKLDEILEENESQILMG